MNIEDRFSKIKNINGKQFQFDIAIEECSEFIQACQKYKRNKTSIDDVIGEMADVLVTFGCLKASLREDDVPDVDDKIDDIIDMKTKWAEDYDGHPDNSLTWQDFKQEQKPSGNSDDILTPEDEELIKERLRQLGYL